MLPRVKLISYSKFVEDLDAEESEVFNKKEDDDITADSTVQETKNNENKLVNMIAYCARVSNPTNQNNHLTSRKLVQYLIDKKHWSPFEMVSICLKIETTRDIARQILRHRSFSFQEFSQRYASPEMEFEKKELRLQDTKNRQNSLETDDEELGKEWERLQDECASKAKEVYNWAVSNNIAKEQARSVLPEGMTHTTLYMHGTMRSWLHYLESRTYWGTQKEHRILAKMCQEEIQRIFPINDFIK